MLLNEINNCIDMIASYGMARSRLSLLVSSLMQGQSVDHASRLMLLPKSKYTAAEEKVVQAYHKTVQLQVRNWNHLTKVIYCITVTLF